ncbi:MAG: hypothetical protein M3378_06920 [Actinomycetota bacterium]|nr:hypothetical protein [Actinomycetota bacterium]
MYPYQEDGPRLGSVVLRSIVPITLVGPDIAPTSLALVDSGCEHVLAAPWLANAVGVDAKRSHRRLDLGIGGQTVEVRFSDLTLRLHPPDGGDDEFVEWQAEVGFVHHWRPTWPIIVGQVGFLDKFTVSMSRLAQQVAVESGDEFDRRFGFGYIT